MSKDLIMLGSSNEGVLTKLQDALKQRFAESNPAEASYLAGTVMVSLIRNENLISVGEAVADLGDIFENFPTISTEDRGAVKGILSKIQFVKLSPDLQKIARDEIAIFLGASTRPLLPIAEDQYSTEEEESTKKEEGRLQPAALLTNNFARFVPPSKVEQAVTEKPSSALFSNKFARFSPSLEAKDSTK